MNLTLEIENNEDYLFITQLVQRLKGVKIVSNDYKIIEGVPAHVFDAIDQYGANLKEEDLISKEEFFNFIDDEICRLNSQN